MQIVVVLGLKVVKGDVDGGLEFGCAAVASTPSQDLVYRSQKIVSKALRQNKRPLPPGGT